MENIKIFATPKAYEWLSDQNAHNIIKGAVEGLFRVVRSGSCNEVIITDCPLGISANWANEKGQISYILIYDKKNYGAFYSMNLEMFQEKLETAVQIFLD